MSPRLCEDLDYRAGVRGGVGQVRRINADEALQKGIFLDESNLVFHFDQDAEHQHARGGQCSDPQCGRGACRPSLRVPAWHSNISACAWASQESARTQAEQ